MGNRINFLSKVGVIFYRGTVNPTYTEDPEADPYLSRVPVRAERVGVKHIWNTRIIRGNPKDWMNRTYQGGQVALSGLLANRPLDDLWFQTKFFEKIRIEDYMILYGCRVNGISLQMTGVSNSGLFCYSGNLEWSFDAYEELE